MKKSKFLINILSLLILFISIEVLGRIYFVKSIENDAALINNLGVLRGSIQRITKLEMNNVHRDDLISFIGEEFKTISIDNKLLLHSEVGNFNDVYDEFHNKWINTLKKIYDYRENPSVSNKYNLLKASEEMWIIGNDTVGEAQIITELKVKYYKNFGIIIFVHLCIGIFAIIYVKKYIRDKLEVMAIYDQLTEVYNRNYFNEYIRQAIQEAKQYNRKLALIMIDIDRFKNVNDTYGHDAGDYVLHELAQIINLNIGNEYILSRVGGEEFIVVIPEGTIEIAETLGENVRALIENHDFNGIHKITISVGVTEFLKEDTKETLLKRVDTALYKAKGNGRNKVESIKFQNC